MKDKAVNPGFELTIEAIAELDAESEDATILSLPLTRTWTSPFVAYRLGFRGRSSVPTFEVTVGGTLISVDGLAIGVGEVHHIAGTFDGSSLRAFVDGTLVMEEPAAGTVAQSQEPMTIGVRSSTDPGGYLIGRLHELRIFDAARTSEQIHNWHDRRLAPSEQGLVALWNE